MNLIYVCGYWQPARVGLVLLYNDTRSTFHAKHMQRNLQNKKRKALRSVLGYEINTAREANRVKRGEQARDFKKKS